MFAYATAPQKFKHLIRNIFSAYPVILKKLWWFIIVLSFLQILVSIFSQRVSGAIHLGGTVQPLLPVIAFLLISVLISIYFGVVALFSSDQALRQTNINWSATFRYGLERYWHVLGYVALLFLGYFITALLFGVITGLVLFGISKGLHTNLESLIPVFWVLYGILYVFFILIIYWGMPAIILDKVKFLPAFKVAFRLMKGNWWRVFFVCLMMGIIMFLIFVPFGIVTFLIAYYSSSAAQFWGQLISYLTVLLVTLVTFPLMMGTILVVYKDLKLRKPTVVGS